MKRFRAVPRAVVGRRPLRSPSKSPPHPGAAEAVQPLEARQLLAADVVISELMHHTPTGDPGQEFIELYNRGDAAAFVGGWAIDQGVGFAFPSVTIGAGGYLVVAADVAKFGAKYPGVSNVVGNWTGQLSNGGESVRVIDNTGATVDKVSYADSGDWAVRRRGVLDHGHEGWQWVQPADGQGPSLELINAGISNDHGANWTSSIVSGGTPGRANSVASADIAPMILDLAQTPAIPHSTDPVGVTLRVLDEAGAPSDGSVELHYRVDALTPPPFQTLTMRDDGAGGDAVAGDNVFFGLLPAQADRSVVEFYASASDVSGNTRTWPGPTDDFGTQGANLLYQVDDTAYAGPQPIYRLVMTEQERAEIADIGNGGPSQDQESNAQMNATFVAVDGTGTDLRYQAGVRNRGHGSRFGPPNNYRVNFSGDHPYHGATAVNFNVATVHSQVLGSAIFRLAGIEAPDARAVQVRVNGSTLVANYAMVEEADGDFAAEHFPGDGNGAYYSAFRTDPGVPYEEADLRYEGTNPAAYQDTYFKQTNKDVNDWSDLIHLTDVLNNAPDASFVHDVSQVIDLPQWLRMLALDELLMNRETGIVRGIGDDYGFYRGVTDPRFKLVPHDLDTLLNQGNSAANVTDSVFSNIEGTPGSGGDGVEGLRRLLTHKDVVPQYYQAFIDLIRDTFNPQTLNPLIDRLLGPFTPAANIAQIKQLIVDRGNAVLAQIPRGFTATSPLPLSGGYRRTTSPTALLNGTADAAATHSVIVNGQLANYAPRTGRWSLGSGTGTTTTVVPTGSTWKYLATTGDPGTAWRATTFTDTGWAQATGRLGWGDGQPGAVPQTPTRVTTYFRHTFDVANPAVYSALTLKLQRDDAAVVYLNGQQVAISNLDPGFNYLTRPTAVVSGAEETQYFTFTVDPSRLRAGANVLAVEVHDAVNSSDLDLDVGLDATVAGTSSGPGVPLNPGVNRLVVQALDGPNGTGNEIGRTFVDVWYDAPATSTAPPAPVDAVNLLAPAAYRAGTPVLVQASALFNGSEQRDLWDATVTLTTNRADVTLSTNQITLRNGLGSALVTLGGAGVAAGVPVVLTATYSTPAGPRTATKTLNSLGAAAVTTVSGTLAGAATTWSGVVHVTGDVVVPVGHTLTINPGTLVLIDGVASGDQGKDIEVLGTLRSLGTAASPVVITAFDAALPWGELRHTNAQPSLYQYTLISRAGNSPGGGHTGKGPVLRATNSKITFDHATMTDNVGKIAQTSGADLTFTHAELSRSIAGAEIDGTALLHEYTWTEDMRGTDDNDGIYLHTQRAGQSIVVRHSVFAGVDDDGIDTLGSDVLIDDVIIRDAKDKGLSTLAGVVTVRNSLLANNTLIPEDGTAATISAKAGVGFTTAVVNLDHVTVYAPVVAIEARDKFGEPNDVITFNVTNSILIGSDAIRTDYNPADIHVSYSTLSEAWPGAGNLNADPMFTDPAGHNFHLRPGSPALNSGDPGSPADPDGTRADQGFYRTGAVDAGPSATTLPAGPLRPGTTVLTPQAGVYHVTGAVVVPTGSTLQILPGTSLFFDPGASITVRDGGRLLAEGTLYNQIRFTLSPGATGTWDGIQFVNSMSDNRITWSVLEYGGNATTNAGMVGLTNSNLLLDHDYFDHNDHRRVRFENSSLVLRNSEFADIFPGPAAPTTNNLSEHVWGNGIAAGGQVLIDNNVFGVVKGHNDAVDVGSAQRPGPIFQITNNLFKGGGDDALDLEGDAHVEGNTFLHFHKDQFNVDTGNSNAMSLGGGRDYVVVRNVFQDVDHVALVKDGAFADLENNTAQNVSAQAVYFELAGDTITPGRGVKIDGSIFKDVAVLLGNIPAGTTVTLDRSAVPAADVSRGTGNTSEDPRLANPAAGDFTLRPGSPARSAGPNGLDMGAAVPGGAWVTGVPTGTTGRNSVSLTVAGPGVTHYKFRLDNGAWSAERPVSTPLVLSGLSGGAHALTVVGKNSAGVWHDPDASTTHAWTVDTSLPTVRLSEVLAVNTAAVEHGGFPDLIELYNEGTGAVDLSGMSISDDAANPRKFVFAAGTLIQAGQYLTLYGDSRAVAGEVHVKFSLKAGGEGVFLYNAPANGGRLIDSVVFGQQASDFSVGRLGDGLGAPWVLTRPTFGAANVAQRTGDPAILKINEWLADGTSPLSDDFIELFNPDALPVSLDGLSLTDHIGGKPGRSPIAPLSFVGGGASGFLAFLADGEGANGADHTTFRLNADGGQIGLIDLSKPQYHGFVDRIVYGPQRTDVSQGRSPDGGPLYGLFNPPTPGAPNLNVAASPLTLRVTEIMYHPSDAPPRSEFVDKDFEYVELRNTGTAPLSLSGVKFTQGVNFNFPDMTLQPGQYVLVVENAQAFQSRYGTGRPVIGQYDGDLDDSGERLRLEAVDGSTIQDFAFGDANWYPLTDGPGYSLVINDPSAPVNTWGQKQSWHASKAPGGSPGVDEPVGPAPAAVLGRHVFYNNSVFDGSAAATADDDRAIAPDKKALLPGATATFENYTSYSKGINGLFLDVLNFVGTPTAADFTFRAGSGADPSTWTAAPVPTAVTIRRGAGEGGSDRITITFADGAVTNRWLRVTVRQTGNTGLAKPDVFYFGNLVAETGNGSSTARVDAMDLLALRKNVSSRAAPATSRFDFNRDGRVNAQDTSIARRSLHGATLPLINAPAAAPAAAGTFAQTPIGAAPAPAAPLKTAVVWDATPPDLLGRPA